ncbi:hypothetical protein [Wolbachia endosymbiont of Wuchereria bancrofti]|uniref:hypothetical protein n=1 Tax=Wolbachia endosymbiont of Wuchereria bancrofti TaxID=96496 RepID=UPI000B4DD2D0|nr:hypothetical protein [Wolbachia endosymbiont of Wuchereria bancrofti]
MGVSDTASIKYPGIEEIELCNHYNDHTNVYLPLDKREIEYFGFSFSYQMSFDIDLLLFSRTSLFAGYRL